MMLALALTMLTAAPAFDGVYVDPQSAAFLAAPGLSAEELTEVEYVAFTKTEVTFHYVLESEKQKWKPAADGLVVEGSTVAWKQQADGSIETGFPRWEKLVFVKGDFDTRYRAAKETFRKAQLVRLAGKYGPVEIDQQGLLLEGKRVAIEAYACIPDCGTEFSTVCLGARDVVWIERDNGLLQVKDTRELCGSRTGIHTEGGKLLLRSTSVDAAQLKAAIDARGLGRCLEKRPVTVSVTLAPSGMISAVNAGAASDCLSKGLSKLVFGPQLAPSVVSVTY